MMLHRLNVFNPARWFFTASDFEEFIMHIDKDISKVKICETPSTTHRSRDEEIVKILEKNYALAHHCLSIMGNRKLDRKLAFFIGEIFNKYGLLYYQKSFFCCSQILLASLNLYMYAFGLTNECMQCSDYPTLEILRMKTSNALLFTLTEDSLLKTNVESCVGEAYSSTLAAGYPDRCLISFAETIRWIGHAYQQIDKKKRVGVKNDHLFTHLFTLAEALLLLANNEESVRELGDLYYRAWPFMYGRQHPEDLTGICKMYNKALACDHSLEMQVKVDNMKFMILFAAGEKQKALFYIEEALSLSKTLITNEHNRFLMAYVHNNYAGYLLECDKMNLSEAMEPLEVAVGYGKECRANAQDHLYFAIFDIRLAEVKMLHKEYLAAEEAIKSALNTLNKFPESSQSYMTKAKALYETLKDINRSCSQTISS